jgi:hypothetical protein
MSTFSDKIRLVPDIDARQKASYTLPRGKLKLFILLIMMTATFLLFHTTRRNEIFSIENEYTLLSESQVQPLTTDKEIDINTDYDDDDNDDYGEGEKSESNGTKYVLFWTRFFNNPDWYTGKDEAGEEVLKSVQCPVTNCIFTHNKDLLNKNVKNFDAIAFHGPEYRMVPLPTERSLHQLYIFVSLE